MLHWNSWWVEQSDKASNTTAGLPSGAASWSPDAWLAWQQSWWDQGLQASMAWWRLYGDVYGDLYSGWIGAATPVMQWGNDTATSARKTPALPSAQESPRQTALASPREARASARVRPKSTG